MVSLCGYHKVVSALGCVVRRTEDLIAGGWADMVSGAIASIAVSSWQGFTLDRCFFALLLLWPQFVLTVL